MMRGTFANIRIKNEMVPGVEGGVTTYNGEQMPIYDAAMKHKEDGTPLVVVAGKEYVRVVSLSALDGGWRESEAAAARHADGEEGDLQWAGGARVELLDVDKAEAEAAEVLGMSRRAGYNT